MSELHFMGTEPIDGLGWGSHIHRRHDPKYWLAELSKVPDEHRAGAEEYLRGIAARIRVARQTKRERG